LETSSERSGTTPEPVRHLPPPGNVVHQDGAKGAEVVPATERSVEIVARLAPGTNDGKLPDSEAENLAAIFEGAGSPNTRRAYRRIGRDYSLWCRENGFTPCPAHAQTILGYLSSLHREEKSFSAIDQALAAISKAHRTKGYGFNATGVPVTDGSGGLSIRRVPAVQILLSELKKRLPPPEKKTPLVVSELERVLSKVRKTVRGRRDRAIILLGFMTACRRSELVKLDFEDLAVVEDEGRLGVEVTFGGGGRRRKTDQTGRKAHAVAVPKLDDPDLAWLCAFEALSSWLEAARITTGPIFRPVRKKTVLERRLSARQVARIVKKYVEKAGLDPKAFAGHSLRSGFMTEGFERRVALERLMKQSGHTSAKVAGGYVRPERGVALLRNSPVIDMFFKKGRPQEPRP
jgi:integrase